MLEAVRPATGPAAHADGLVRIDEGLAARVGALRAGRERRLAARLEGGGGRAGGASFGRPRALVRTRVGVFGAVVEAVGVLAGFAAEGEEVELVAVFVVAVRADALEVAVDHGEGGLGSAGRGRRIR